MLALATADKPLDADTLWWSDWERVIADETTDDGALGKFADPLRGLEYGLVFFSTREWISSSAHGPLCDVPRPREVRDSDVDFSPWEDEEPSAERRIRRASMLCQTSKRSATDAVAATTTSN